MFFLNPLFWAGVILIAIAYWFDLDSPTNTVTFRVLLIAYAVTSSIVIFDVRLGQERQFNKRDVGSLPEWTIIFYWIAYACAIALIFISWRAFITIFVLRFILKLLPVLETIGRVLMIPFYRPPNADIQSADEDYQADVGISLTQDYGYNDDSENDFYDDGEDYEDNEDERTQEEIQAEIDRLRSEVRRIEADQTKLRGEFVDRITEMVGDRDAAHDVFQEMLLEAELEPGSPEYFCQQAHIHWTQGKRERALIFFNKALPEDRDDIWSRDDAITVMNRGNLQLELGNFDDSILDLECAAAIDSSLPTANAQILRMIKPENRERLRQSILNKDE